MDLSTLYNRLPKLPVEINVEVSNPDMLHITMRDDAGDEPSKNTIECARTIMNYVKSNFKDVKFTYEAIDEWIDIVFVNV